jgi:hypothetical protein
MKIISHAIKFTVLSILLAAAAFGQTGQPKQEKLLNGLKILMWPDSNASNVNVRIRIHSGAAFDPQGKEGVMKMLAENVFPNEAAREYFHDDLGGSLEIVTTYDYIEINAVGKSESFLQMLETMATAVENPAIDKDTTTKLRNSLLTVVKQLEADPAYVADRAAASRLLGTFPYGRPMYGSSDSVEKILYPDLIDARERFLTADNATVSVSGNFERSLGLRAIRRLFGGWLKSDKRVISSFRQPDPPSASIQVVATQLNGIPGLRFAARGVARKDKDFAAARVFAGILATRLKSAASSGNAGDPFVRSEEHVLPGIFLVGFNAKSAAGSDVKPDDGATLAAILAAPVTDAEFAVARSAFAAEWSRKDGASFWLDADTFGIANVDLDIKAADNLRLADVVAYADKLRRSPMAAVLVKTQPTAN